MYIPRYLEENVRKVHRTFKVLYLGGPRQVGKSTMLLHLARSRKMTYVTLDDLAQRELAQKDPELFLQTYPAPLLIDEVQYAPALFSSIKLRVDRSSKTGQYWLTGSQQFGLMRHMQESLAGRVGILTLLGFSRAEAHREKRLRHPFFPKRAYHPIQDDSFTIHDIYSLILRGSFPAVWLNERLDRTTYYNSYIQTYIDRDLRDIFHVTKISEFHTFLRLCAARTGSILSVSELARDTGISVHAAREWLSILENTRHIYLLRPYFSNISKRLIKSPKIYFLDTGLAAYLTNWKTAEVLGSGAMAGAFFETLIVGEIIKSYLFRGEEPPLYYLRDKEGHEVDVLIERERILYPLEIKIAARVVPSDCATMRYFRNKIPKIGPGAVITPGSRYQPIDREHTMIPLSAIS
ncbi:ATP-binding protein [Candidatus Uhrbacteria bacterium]|nr:ATP-binding protein [Candidatus Uhrbacteria bacterium]